MAKVLVLGAGIMGLAAAYQALVDGYDVEVLEAAPEVGGMAAHFDLAGTSTERFYHFICKTDFATFDLLKELKLEDRLHWVRTSMGFFSNGQLSKWGDPVSLFRFPKLSLIDKCRYALFAFVCVRRDSWPSIERESAHSWIRRWCGERVYNRFWRSLLHLKFYEYAEDISALWIWTRIRRIGRSRRNPFQEELGYLTGGSETLVKALAEAIQARGGSIHTSRPGEQVVTSGGRVVAVRTPSGLVPAEHVISTVPTPLVSSIVPDLPAAWRQRYEAIHNIGVICVVFKLRQSVSPHFWINVSEPEFGIPGVIEFSNLRRAGADTIIYVPYYMPVTNPKWALPDQALIDEAFTCLCRIQPRLDVTSIITTHVARLKYGQPICEPGFADKLPPIQTPIEGLQVADTCFYYPEDRGISESVRLGRQMARSI